MRRVVITGVGAVSPCGKDLRTTWENVVEGKSGIERIQRWDPTDMASQIAGECRDFDPEQYIEKKRVREMARFIHLAMGASHQAIESAGFEPDDALKDRTGTFIGVGFCGLEAVEQQHEILMTKGARRVSPYFIPSAISNLAPGQVSMRWGLRGPSYTTTSACSSGAHAIGEAFRWIQRGGIDAAIAGGAEASVTPLGVAGFAAMRALSKRNDEPQRASRPFDRDRDGFVIAEGAGIVMLEEREAAMKRGAPILAEVIGYGATADAYHLTQPAPEGEGAQRAMRAALLDAQLAPSDIDYVNAHGTSTPTGDVQELQAIRSVFGAHAQDHLWISSTKSAHGHLLGAAGGLEAVIATLTIRDGVVAPTINLDSPDPACEGLELVPHTARRRATRVAMSNSFGFGGTNVTLVLRAH
ncbi:MAG: beta-ketoacyl-ACP synthase II [Myxococcota bacterium]|jgi:3-oxoacyl-[acyl-carrier-protein] synthase II|nr:beta-ketoacyl-ACP synthase II [Myxococcota bacterium]